MVEPIIVPCATEADWHAQRAKAIGASEAAALFGVHPYLTPLQLWMRKKEGREDTRETEAMEAGHFAELMLAPWYEKRTGRHVARPQDFYGCLNAAQVIVRHPTLPLQATPDRIIARGLPDCAFEGILQLKSTDRALLDEWEDERGVKVPLHVQVQVQAEMFCTGMVWGSVAAVIGGNKLRHCDVEADSAFQAALAKKAEEFWASLASDTPPPPGAGDLELMKSRWPSSAPGLIGEVRPELVIELARARAMKGQIEDVIEQLSARLLEEAKDAEILMANGRKIARISNIERNEEARPARVSRYRQINIDSDIRKQAKDSLPSHVLGIPESL